MSALGLAAALILLASGAGAAEDRYGEIVSPAGAAVDREIADLAVASLKKSAGPGLTTRDAHAKQHGCVRAVFTVNDDKTLPSEYRSGVFAEPGKKYAAWIRFSNGGSKPRPDKDGDARGMAVKLMGVEGAKLLDGERDAKTQDFLMISHDAFFIKDAKDYLDFFKRIDKGSSPFWFFFGRLPWRWTEFRTARRILAGGKRVLNPLSARYFSTTPYLLGGENVVKYSARPCAKSPAAENNFPGSPDYLRLNMERSLKTAPACFDFMVQKRAGPAMSVEDSRAPWDEGKSAFTPVATIVIPSQEFSSDEQVRFCENLSFTPWHALPAHRPLGNINRTRKVVYEAVSTFRHEANHAVRTEPAQ